LNEPVVDREGYLHAPQGPGLGVEIDFDLIKSKTIAVLT
jgi:L-alanine-DL-glutamate epimerase-like enolase superfamily enzyme